MRSCKYFFLVLIITLALLWFYTPTALHVNELIIHCVNTSLGDETLTIEGDITSSAIAFRSYSLRISGDDVFVTIKGCLVGYRHHSGSYAISIDVPPGIRNVYLEGGNERKLIYSFE